jgi:hypothetical protein
MRSSTTGSFRQSSGVEMPRKLRRLDTGRRERAASAPLRSRDGDDSDEDDDDAACGSLLGWTLRRVFYSADSVSGSPAWQTLVRACC